MRQRPLAGVRVLDLTNVLAGPYCSYQLVLFGAEVVKIEVPDRGDLARRLGPDPELNKANLGISFLAQNAGKKSIELDLKDPADKARFARLVSVADVLVENFRPGVMARFGFDWDWLRQLNTGLIYCAISGFGQTGPMSQAPAYDQVIQGLSGMMSVTGTPDTAPLRVGFPVCDTVGGLTAALAIATALAGRHRDGLGCFLDVSMLESSVSAMGWTVSNYLVGGVVPQAMGDQNATAAPSGTFDASDGPINIAANRQQQYETLCRLVDRLDLLDDPRFSTVDERKLHRDELNQALNQALDARTALEWEELLSAAGVPAARILTVPDMVRLEQLGHRQFFTQLPFPDADGGPDRSIQINSNGVLVDGERLHAAGPPPRLGQHNNDIEDLVRAWQETTTI